MENAPFPSYLSTRYERWPRCPRVQGVQLRPIENIPDVTFCLNQFKKKIRMYGQPYEPIKLQVYVVCVYLCTFGIEPLPMFDCGFTTVLVNRGYGHSKQSITIGKLARNPTKSTTTV